MPSSRRQLETKELQRDADEKSLASSKHEEDEDVSQDGDPFGFSASESEDPSESSGSSTEDCKSDGGADSESDGEDKRRGMDCEYY